MKLLKTIVATSNSWTPTIARLTLGVVMLPHGLQKTFGLFGGYGFEATMGFFTGTMGIPYIFALLAIAAEFLGSLGLIAGLLSRVAAFGVGFTMLVATLTTHSQFGFFMNWSGKAAGEGFEYHLLAIGLALVVIISGGGKYSLDQKVTERL